MRSTYIFIYLLVCVSSDLKSLDSDRDQFGFTFRVANKSGVEHKNVKITIGGMQNGEFVGTDSYLFPKILVLSNDWPDTKGNQSQTFAFYEERWNPNLAEIKAISNQAYFTIELEGEELISLYDSQGGNQGELLSFEIPQDFIVINDYGKMRISFESSGTVLGDLTVWD